MSTLKYVSLENKFMKVAYSIAKSLYNKTEWNFKTTPIVVIVKDGKIITTGIANKGQHVLQQKCDRLGRPGTPYTDCKWCTNEEHAEIHALQNCKGQNIKDATVYLYGHYRFCKPCLQALKDRGVKTFVVLKDAITLFDRHHPDTVLGTKKQFEF